MIEGVKKYRGKGHLGGIGWELIAKEMPRLRSGVQCSTRWNACLRARLNGARVGRWTEAEVRTIICEAACNSCRMYCCVKLWRYMVARGEMEARRGNL